MRSVVLVLGGVIAGFVLQQLLGTARWEQRGAAQAPAGECAFDWERLRAELRAAQASTPNGVVTQRAPSAASPAGGQAGSAAVAQSARTAEQEQAFKDHAALLVAAEQAGVWTEDDVRRSRRLLPLIAPADRAKALSSLAVAINSQRLKLTASAPF